VTLAERVAFYRSGFDEVVSALEGITDEELDRNPPSGWTARLVVHHLADSELRSCIRLRQLLAEDAPHIQGYDEEHYARVLAYDRPIEGSLATLEAVREANLELLERITEDDLARSGRHEESGVYTLDDWLTIYGEHPREHADQIRRARQGLD
jgi:hypothetical protein